MSDNKQPIDAAPLPWTVGDELEDFAVLDAERRVVARVASRFYNHEDGCRKAKEMAVRIAKADWRRRQDDAKMDFERFMLRNRNEDIDPPILAHRMVRRAVGGIEVVCATAEKGGDHGDS